MTPVHIVIRTTYRSEGAKESAVCEYEGRRFEKDKAAVLRYEEVFCEGADPVMTTMYVADNEVRIHRKGSIGGDMVFCEATPCEFFYRTGFGNLPMEIHTHRLLVEKKTEGITVRIVYTLFSGDDAVSETEMEITVTQA